MSKAKVIMVQGTASSVGKSVICAALCRIFKQDGYNVAPFKAQNMALNSFVTAEGGEIGRAQAVQAEAAGIPPTVDMNPVLLKPTANAGCQVVVLGKVAKNISANDYTHYAKELLPTVTEALERLRATNDIVVIEGAGSPAEINLKEHEIVNMRLAKAAGAPVLLVGDIDKGGVFASLVGTLELFDEDERRYVKGMIINKFRGEVALLKPATDFLEKRTGLPVLGVLPWFRDIRIAQEDSVYLDERKSTQDADGPVIAVIRLPHIANYDDFDPLEQEGCRVDYVNARFMLGNPHLIILPGTKSTAADLDYLRYSGLANDILAKAHAGTPVAGICGGYQMLGKKIYDPQRVESDKTEVEGLGLLDIETEFLPEKSTTQVRGEVSGDAGLLAGLKGTEITGYEIHMGRTRGGEKNACRISGTPQGETDYPDGSIDAKGKIMGTYLHGLFYNDDFRQGFLNNLRRMSGLPDNRVGAGTSRDGEYDKLAELVRRNMDIDKVYKLMEDGI
jgi:adenosylcobyric acid synthase